MTDGMDKYWIIPRVGDKELPHVGHQLASCSLLNYVFMFLCTCTILSSKKRAPGMQVSFLKECMYAYNLFP